MRPSLQVGEADCHQISLSTALNAQVTERQRCHSITAWRCCQHEMSKRATMILDTSASQSYGIMTTYVSWELVDALPPCLSERNIDAHMAGGPRTARNRAWRAGPATCCGGQVADEADSGTCTTLPSLPLTHCHTQLSSWKRKRYMNLDRPAGRYGR